MFSVFLFVFCCLVRPRAAMRWHQAAAASPTPWRRLCCSVRRTLCGRGVGPRRQAQRTRITARALLRRSVRRAFRLARLCIGAPLRVGTRPQDRRGFVARGRQQSPCRRCAQAQYTGLRKLAGSTFDRALAFLPDLVVCCCFAGCGFLLVGVGLLVVGCWLLVGDRCSPFVRRPFVVRSSFVRCCSLLRVVGRRWYVLVVVIRVVVDVVIVVVVVVVVVVRC